MLVTLDPSLPVCKFENMQAGTVQVMDAASLKDI